MFTINVYTGYGLASDFPENTYTSVSIDKVLEIAKDVLMRTNITGIHRIEVFDEDEAQKRYDVGMCPMCVD